LKTQPVVLEALNDNTLMDKVKNGDIDKLGLLFERYKKPLYGFFYGINRDCELSEDLVQNVFVRILKYREVFRGDGEFRSWMFHIARNVSHDHYRKKRIDARDSIEDWQDYIPAEDSIFSELQKEGDMQLLARAFEKLSEDKREVLLLSKYQDKKYKEIAEQIGSTESAVKVKIFRALRELKELYREIEAKH
jgi:RNA polymerase sigma factor (sigma-70 family)